MFQVEKMRKQDVYVGVCSATDSQKIHTSLLHQVNPSQEGWNMTIGMVSAVLDDSCKSVLQIPKKKNIHLL